MSTTKNLVGVYQRNSITGTYTFYPEATEKSGFPLSTLVLHGSGEHKEVYTLQDIEAAFAKMGIVGSDTERDFQYLLRNL